MPPTFRTSPGSDGYYATTDGRWKARNHKDGVTLTDTTGQARFPQNDNQRWLRVPDWAAAREVIRAFSSVPRG